MSRARARLSWCIPGVPVVYARVSHHGVAHSTSTCHDRLQPFSRLNTHGSGQPPYTLCEYLASNLETTRNHHDDPNVATVGYSGVNSNFSCEEMSSSVESEWRVLGEIPLRFL